MKVLTLSIKQQYFDEIIAGTKTHEYREVRPTNVKKYVYFEHQGKTYDNQDDIPEDDNDVTVVPVKYDAIKFLTGAYSGKRPWALVEVKDAQWYVLTDEEGKDITYEYEGREVFLSEMDYTLGKVLERSDY